MLYLAILRSPHAHARVAAIDLPAARAAAGVRLAVARQRPHRQIGSIRPNWVLRGTHVPDRPVMAVDRPATAERGGSGLRSSTILN